jgi:methanesulfonate monooxygenase large subunit
MPVTEEEGRMTRNAEQWATPLKLPHDHYVSAQVYSDPDLYLEEQEKIFRKTWRFACHESEVPALGDYRTLTWAGMPLVVIRGVDDRIRGFVNTCSHRSALVARGPSGNAKTLTCFFHLWQYDTKGACVSMTRDLGYRQEGPRKEEMGLRAVRTALRFGMVFINLDDKAPSFDEFAGDALAMVEEVMGQKPLEVYHYHEARIRANWKQWHETNMEDYHNWGHAANRITGMQAKGHFERKWKLYPNGHGTIEPMKIDYARYKGWQDRQQNTLPGLAPGEFRVVDLFPNTTIIVRATCIRIDTSTPMGPGETLLEHRGLGVKGESTEERAARIRDHNQFWGPFGRNLVEDVIFVEAVEECNRNGAAQYSVLARHEDLRAQDDAVMRHFHGEWSTLMGRPACNPRQQLTAATE